MLIFQVEYREVGKNYNLIADFGNVINYKSSTEKDKKNLSHFFGKYDLDLNLKNYLSSSINISTERVTNDSYIKLFSPIFLNNDLKPDTDTLENKIKLNLEHEDYLLESGVEKPMKHLIQILVINTSIFYHITILNGLLSKIILMVILILVQMELITSKIQINWKLV